MTEILIKPPLLGINLLLNISILLSKLGEDITAATEGATPRSESSVPLTDGPPEYKLVAFISHMGTSTCVGHYVCHILKEGRWVIYNDEKVALSENQPKKLGYLYLYQRKTSS